jgi:hypothetical protein
MRGPKNIKESYLQLLNAPKVLLIDALNYLHILGVMDTNILTNYGFNEELPLPGNL